MDEDEELYREMNEEDPYYMGDKEDEEEYTEEDDEEEEEDYFNSFDEMENYLDEVIKNLEKQLKGKSK